MGKYYCNEDLFWAHNSSTLLPAGNNSFDRRLAQFIVSNGTINGTRERFGRKRHDIISLTTAVSQWLKCCATNREVAGSIPDGVTVIFH